MDNIKPITEGKWSSNGKLNPPETPKPEIQINGQGRRRTKEYQDHLSKLAIDDKKIKEVVDRCNRLTKELNQYRRNNGFVPIENLIDDELNDF